MGRWRRCVGAFRRLSIGASMRELNLDEVDHIAGGGWVEALKQIAISVVGSGVYDGLKNVWQRESPPKDPPSSRKEDDGSVPRAEAGLMIDNGLHLQLLKWYDVDRQGF